jgi:WD40 repeat protein
MQADAVAVSEGEARKLRISDRIYNRWFGIRCLLHGLSIAWVSVVSVVLGALLFLIAPQAQDLFLEVTGDTLTSAGYWLAFYIAVMAFWGLPVYVSSRWILSRFEEGSGGEANPDIRPVKPWVRQRLPAYLTVACFGAVLLGQIMALNNAPTIADKRAAAQFAKIESATSQAIDDAQDQCAESSQKAVCLIARTSNAVSVWVAAVLSRDLGSRRVILIMYGIVTGVVIWLWLRERLTAWSSKIGRIGGEIIWWLVSIVLAVPLLTVLVVAVNFAMQEWSKDLNLAHMVVLPGLTGLAAYLAWKGLKSRSARGVTVIGRLISRVFHVVGVVDETSASNRIVRPLYAFVAIGSVLVLLTPFVVHPVVITGTFLHRGLLLPLLLGALVAPFTYISHWSVRCQAPLVILVVLLVSGTTFFFGDTNDVRTVSALKQAEPDKRESLEQAIKRWANLNGCNVDTEENARACPHPFIISAAGGASRSAFHVVGVIGKLMDEGTQTFGPNNFFYKVDVSADGRRIVTASGDNTAHIWDATTGNEIMVLRGHEAPVISAAFNSDGTRVVTASNDLTARIWDVATGSEIKLLQGHKKSVMSAAFSRDGRRIVTASFDNSARIWDVATGTEIKILKGHESAVISAVFSPDGMRIATASDDKTARIWDAGTGNEIRVLRGHEGIVSSVAFSPDGMRIITASLDKTARIWDAATGSEITVLRGHENFVTSAAFSPDGTRIVTASYDKTARIWDAATGSEITVLRGHEKNVFFALFSPDGTHIVTSSYDDTTRIWNAATGREERTLKRSKQWELLPFDKQLFAISGVSGGSLGAVITYAALADSQPTGSGALGRPPCRNDIKDTDWFAPYVKDSTSREQERWRGCLQELVAGDFLSPVVLTLASGDLFHYQEVGLWSWGDRAAVLERAWERRYASITGKTTLEKPLIGVRQSAESSGRWLPILLLNGTSVTTGRRIVTTDVVEDFIDASDFYVLSGQSQKGQNRDISLSTAVTMSARFPIISPHGNIRDVRTDKIVDRVVDGGYFENFGALTASELAKELKKDGLTPVIVLINNEPTTPNLDCMARKPSNETSEAPQSTWFASLGSPLQAVLAARQARGTHAAAVLCQEISDQDRFVFVTVERDPDNPNKDLSMSWWLSKHVQKYLDDELDPELNPGRRANNRAFQKITAERKLLHPIDTTGVKVSSQ